MQIGTRWPTGTQAPNSAPDSVAQLCTRIETEQHLTGAWTLTWLEHRAVATHTSGIRVLEHTDGSATAHMPDTEDLESDTDDNDDWLT